MSYMLNTIKFVHKTKKHENTSFYIYFTGILQCDIWPLMVKFNFHWQPTQNLIFVTSEWEPGMTTIMLGISNYSLI